MVTGCWDAAAGGVSKEVTGFDGDVYGRKELGVGGENAMWKRVGRVAPAGDVPSDNVAIWVYKLACDPFEDAVDMLVPAVAVVPRFDNTLIVSMNEKGGTGLNDAEKSVGKEL